MNAAALRVGELTIPVLAGGSGRRAQLTIDRDGSLLLRAAADVSGEELRDFVRSKRSWIFRKLAEKERAECRPPVKELVDGEGFCHLGRNYRLAIADVDRVKLNQGRLLLPKGRVDDEGAAITAWYTARAQAWLPERARAWEVRLRVKAAAFEVADLGHRWGFAEASGRVRFHWATMQLPPLLVDYLLAHELAHLHEPHHGPAFWRLLRRVQPDYLQRKAELAEVGSSVWLGDVGVQPPIGSAN